MLEQALLREQFQMLLHRQKQAAEGYVGLAETLEDRQLKEQVAHLGREKQRHIRLTERLLELVD